MDTHEVWALGSASAAVERKHDVQVTLSGIVTARAYEDLHLRMSREKGRIWLTIDDAALLTMTCKSAAEAAVRGTSAVRVGPANVIVIRVGSWRQSWAVDHCAWLASEGLFRVTMVEAASHRHEEKPC